MQHRGGVVACRCRRQVQQRCRPHSHNGPLTAAVSSTQRRARHAAHDQGRPATWEVFRAIYIMGGPWHVQTAYSSLTSLHQTRTPE